VLRFLFWNVNHKPLADAIVRLVQEYQADVLMLAESVTAAVTMLQKLNKDSPDFHYAPSRAPTAVDVFTRFSGQFLTPTLESGRVSIRRMALPARVELLLAMVHLPSKSYWSDDSQALECAELARSIRQEEEKAGHSRTLVMGDLNVDPFETGVVSTVGLHGLMTRELASRKNFRTVQEKDYPTFYNPMWGHFGDRSGGPSGSCYQLLTVSHKLEPYPVTARLNGPAVANALAQRLRVSGEELASEAEFIDYLRKVFASEETRRVIGNLLAQVQL
jgi:exonuclease III